MFRPPPKAALRSFNTASKTSAGAGITGPFGPMVILGTELLGPDILLLPCRIYNLDLAANGPIG